MITTFIIHSIIEIFLIIAVVMGFIFEYKLIEFEEKIKEYFIKKR